MRIPTGDAAAMTARLRTRRLCAANELGWNTARGIKVRNPPRPAGRIFSSTGATVPCISSVVRRGVMSLTRRMLGHAGAAGDPRRRRELGVLLSAPPGGVFKSALSVSHRKSALYGDSYGCVAA